jgi:O-antigen/teichoic acid export membrane protein
MPVPLLIGGPQLFRLLLGEGWEASGSYARILVPYLVGHFIVGPLTITPMVIGRQSTAFGFSVVGNVLFVGAIAMVLMPGGSLEQAFLFVSVTQAVYFLAFWLWLVRASGRRGATAKR